MTRNSLVGNNSGTTARAAGSLYAGRRSAPFSVAGSVAGTNSSRSALPLTESRMRLYMEPPHPSASTSVTAANMA